MIKFLNALNILNSFKPKVNIFQIILCTGIILFAIELLFKLFQNIVLFKNGLDLEYFDILKLAGGIGIIGMLIANIRIHKLRSKNTIFPWLILIVIWVFIAIILKQ